MYLKRNMIVNTILKINEFKQRLETLYLDFDIDINDNTGRRNALLSAIQEKVLADELSIVYENVENDGSPGKPDIVIGSIETELECKLTSGSGIASRSYSLQTDFATIQNKESLDYLYIVTNKDMTEYSALYFNSLTANDFCDPPETARGKARMNKKEAFKKAIPIVGGFKNINQDLIDVYNGRLLEVEENYRDKITSLFYNLESYVHSCKIESFISNVNKAILSYTNKVDKIKNKISLWESKDDSYSIVFESIDDLKKEGEANGN